MPHIGQLPSGTWRVIVKHDGRTRTATAQSKREVQQRGAVLLLEMGGGPRRQTATVADLIAHYCAVKAREWSATYQADVDAILDRIPDKFADELANDVTPGDVTRLYRQLAAEGWTPHRLRRLHEILSAAWAIALSEELAGVSPIQNVTKPKVHRRPLHIPTHDQVAAILNAPARTGERLALRLSASLGARRGEIVALQWDDVDIEAKRIHVHRSLSYTPDHGLVVGNTKTGESGHRFVPIGGPTAHALRIWSREQADHPRSTGTVQQWVLSDNGGVTPWRPDRLTHVFADARKAAKVAGVRLHDLRHYVATTKLRNGEPAIKVAYQLGHSSTSTTLDVYGHLMPELDTDSAEYRESLWE